MAVNIPNLVARNIAYEKFINYLARRLQVNIQDFLDVDENTRKILQEKNDLSIICDIMSILGKSEKYVERLGIKVEKNDRRTNEQSSTSPSAST